MDFVVVSYSIYLALGALITLIVGRMLFSRGEIYLRDVFEANQELAGATNQLLRVGFYLVLGGYILVTLKISGQVADLREMIEVLSGKLGTILLAIGILHLFNLLILSTIRRHRVAEAQLEREWAAKAKRSENG